MSIVTKRRLANLHVRRRPSSLRAVAIAARTVVRHQPPPEDSAMRRATVDAE